MLCRRHSQAASHRRPWPRSRQQGAAPRRPQPDRCSGAGSARSRQPATAICSCALSASQLDPCSRKAAAHAVAAVSDLSRGSPTYEKAAAAVSTSIACPQQGRQQGRPWPSSRRRAACRRDLPTPLVRRGRHELSILKRRRQRDPWRACRLGGVGSCFSSDGCHTRLPAQGQHPKGCIRWPDLDRSGASYSLA